MKPPYSRNSQTGSNKFNARMSLKQKMSENRQDNGHYQERHSLTEKRMLRLSFDDIKKKDPFNLRYRHSVANDDYLDKFYTRCSLIPLSIVLALLFYFLWYISPNSRNLRIYQQDIFDWNADGIAAKMKDLEFSYDIVPGVKSTPAQTLNF